MPSPPELFRDDYNLAALERVQPPGQAFELLVTPRFVSHYAEERFEPLTTALIRTVCRRKEVFVDVGAHYGFFTLAAARENPDLEIHALEPIPENLEILRRNLRLNDLETVHCLEQAASSSSGTATIHKSVAADNSGFCVHPEVPSLAEIEIETTTLAKLLGPHPGAALLVKIDTDGHEIPVLEGLEEFLVKGQDTTLIVELNPTMQRQARHDPTDLLSKLEDMGFSIFLLQEEEHRIVPVASDSDWSSLIPPTGYGNLYCRPRTSVDNVCLLSHSHGFAGAERSLAELVEQLVEDHGTVCNVVVPGDGALRSRLETIGVGVIAAEYGWWCGEDSLTQGEIRQRLGDDLARFLARTLPAIEQTRPDVICTNSMVIPYGAITAAILHRPHIWSLHEYGHDKDGYRFFLPRTEILEIVEGFSDFLFGATRTLLDTLFPDLSPESYDFLYPHIRPPGLPAPGPPETASEDGEQPFQLLELSSITRAKQQETDLRALAEVVRRGHDATLLLQGPQDPEYVESLMQLGRRLDIADRIALAEYSPDVWAPIDAADAIVISAPAHSFGRVAAEGMLRGKPVIYPIGTGIAEYMEDGVTGLGYEAGDPRQMADQIERLIEDRQLASEIGTEAYRRALELFPRQGFADKFLDVVRRLRATEPAPRPAWPRPILDSLMTGIQRLGRENLELRRQLRARSAELAAANRLHEVRTEEIAGLEPLLAAREQELAGIKPLLEAREDELASVKPTLEAREQEIAALHSVVAERRAELTAVKKTLTERDKELASLKPVLEARQQELADIKPLLKAREEELANLRPLLAAREKELAAAKPVLEARSEELAALKPILDAKAKELATIKPILDARDEELAALKPIFDAKAKELATLKPILDARDEELAAIKPVLEARQQELAHLEQAHDHQSAEIQALGARLGEIESILARLAGSRLGRLALWFTREK